MSYNIHHLLGINRFLPYFITQFLGAFNDNIFKNALVILATYVLAEQSGYNPQILVTIAAGIFIFPFFIFSGIAGKLADKYPKYLLIRVLKQVELCLMLLVSLGFYFQQVETLMLLLFLMGTQSAFFGPVKYAVVPELLEKDEIIAGNALIESGTYIAILVGTIIGGLVIMTEGGPLFVSCLLIVCASAGVIASRFIPHTKLAQPDITINWNIIAQTWQLMQFAKRQREIFLAILGISWFWLVGAVFLSQFPNYGKFVISGNEQIITLFLTLFAIGIGIGAFICNSLLKGVIQATFVPLSALGMSIFIADLFFVSQHYDATDYIIGFTSFIKQPYAYRIMLDLVFVAICGGVYSVPLYAILQTWCEEHHRSRVIAANNIFNAAFMVIAAIITVVMFTIGFTVMDVFLSLAIANLVVVVMTLYLLPNRLLKSLARIILQFCFRVKLHNMHFVPAQHSGRLIIANHQSFLDGILLFAFVPGEVTFVVNSFTAKLWWVRPFLLFVDVITVDPSNPLSTKNVIAGLQAGKQIVIFPEGRITVTGTLMKVYQGPGAIANRANVPVLPVRIDGAQYTFFSRLKGKVRIRLFPTISLYFQSPFHLENDDTLTGKERRTYLGEKLYGVMREMMFRTSNYEQSLWQSLLDASIIHGASHIIAEDMQRNPISYGTLIRKAKIVGHAIDRVVGEEEKIGVMLPTSVAGMVTFFGLQAYGNIPAMINFTAGSKAIKAACDITPIRHIVTSRGFIEKADLQPVIAQLEAYNIIIHYLEDIRESLSVIDKLAGFLPLDASNVQSDDPAVILYTSGSEGTPKGVVLSHKNLQANRMQLAASVDFTARDIVFNVLPIFHSFGLTGGTLLPILAGIRTFFYPTPLHYKIIPEMIYETNATILFGTNTFFTNYAKHAHPYDFYSLRYVFAGAEALKKETRGHWQEKFGIRILEGYGATETAPALALNTPMHYKSGTVGRLVPGVDYRLEKVESIEEGSKLWVKGPNIMLGYLKAEQPGILQPPEDGWYDTGDIVTMDEEGYITILGRAKRFAKIAGEMVSLSAVEAYLTQLWPQALHAVITVPDAKKGEQLLLVTTQADASRAAIIHYAKEYGIAELAIPKHLKIIDTMPVLGSGKIDYQQVNSFT